MLIHTVVDVLMCLYPCFRILFDMLIIHCVRLCLLSGGAERSHAEARHICLERRQARTVLADLTANVPLDGDILHSSA